MYDIKVVATNIRNARLFRNYSQDYLAFKLGMSQNGYSKIELGYTHASLEKLLIIAQVLQVDLNQLIDHPNINADVEAIARIPVIPKLLEVICQTTNMGFAAVARVTEDRWVACSVRDEISFGLKPGGELKVETTICNEIRQSGKGVVINHVAKDTAFSNHPTPAMYGFESYISVPITRQDGTLFGTLCAIDPKPAKVNNAKTIGMFNLFAELISFYLNISEYHTLTDANTAEKGKRAALREQFKQVMGNDLPNPIDAVLRMNSTKN